MNTTRRLNPVGILLLVALAAAGCGINPPPVDPNDSRACATHGDSDRWQEFMMSAEVTKPAMCPVGLDFEGERKDFVAVIGSGDVSNMQGNVTQLEFVNPLGTPIKDTDGFSVFDTCTFLFNPESDLTECTLDHYYFAGTLGEPAPGEDVFWNKTDSATVVVFGDDPVGLLPGRVELPYTFEPQTAINAPSSVQTMSSVSLWANVLNGREPFQYQWYERRDYEIDWTPVGSNSDTYDTYLVSEATWYFKVRVTDSDGDWRETIHTLGVHAQDDDDGGGDCIICL